MNLVQDVRQFNRFYTRLIGVLDTHLPNSGLTLLEGRVMYEVATGGDQTAADLTRALNIDKAQISRVIRVLTGRKLLVRKIDSSHAKRRILSLSAAGRVVFRQLDEGSRVRMQSILRPLTPAKRRKVAASMRTIQDAFGSPRHPVPAVTLRAPVPGDLGWVIHRQTVLYAQEYGWDWTFEALISKILGEYAANFDASKEDGWIAERAGQIVGSIFLMRGDAPDIAKLRMLYVEPHARGAGVGRRLVDTCIARARELGYRRMTLWTNDVLVSARRLYEGAGFTLTAEHAHRSFGHDLIGQTWELDL